MMRMLEMAVRLPAAAIQLGIKALSDSWGVVRTNAAQGFDGLVSQLAHGLRGRDWPPSESVGDPGREKPAPSGDCLSNDLLKLTHYQILFTKRGLEVSFPAREELVWENLTCQRYETWKIAEFVSRLDDTPVPAKWLEKNYPPGRRLKTIDGKEVWVIHRLPLEDQQYLRVWFQLLRCYLRERLKFAERQLEELAGIRDAIIGKSATTAGDDEAAEPKLLKAKVVEAGLLGAKSLQAEGKEEVGAKQPSPARPSTVRRGAGAQRRRSQAKPAERKGKAKGAGRKGGAKKE